MPVLMQVNYTPTEKQWSQTPEEILAAAETLKHAEGLVWKVWIYNREERLRGGIYLFDTLANARQCGEKNTRKLLTDAGAKAISIVYFDVNEPPSRATRANLGN